MLLLFAESSICCYADRLLASLLFVRVHPLPCFLYYKSMKLMEASKAVMLLRKKLRRGEISYSGSSTSVWECDPVIMLQKLENFRTKLNMLNTYKERSDGELFIYFLSYSMQKLRASMFEVCNR